MSHKQRETKIKVTHLRLSLKRRLNNDASEQAKYTWHTYRNVHFDPADHVSVWCQKPWVESVARAARADCGRVSQREPSPGEYCSSASGGAHQPVAAREQPHERGVDSHTSTSESTNASPASVRL